MRRKYSSAAPVKSDCLKRSRFVRWAYFLDSYFPYPGTEINLLNSSKPLQSWLFFLFLFISKLVNYSMAQKKVLNFNMIRALNCGRDVGMVWSIRLAAICNVYTHRKFCYLLCVLAMEPGLDVFLWWTITAGSSYDVMIRKGATCRIKTIPREICQKRTWEIWVIYFKLICPSFSGIMFFKQITISTFSKMKTTYTFFKDISSDDRG